MRPASNCHHLISPSGGDQSMSALSNFPSRLDLELVTRGLVTTRTKAQRLIRSGKVVVEDQLQTKPSYSVTSTTRISVDLGENYVSRGAYKLVGAFHSFAQLGLKTPNGMDCLDIGASTGGFSDVLLRLGANRVIALDVGHGQLDSRIADDPRIIEISGTNVRNVHATDLPYRPQMVVSDVSFISLTYVIPVISAVTSRNAQIVLLVKPQFEVGRNHLGHHGVVVDEVSRQRALRSVLDCAKDYDMDVLGTAISPIRGESGNLEYLLYARRR